MQLNNKKKINNNHNKLKKQYNNRFFDQSRGLTIHQVVPGLHPQLCG